MGRTVVSLEKKKIPLTCGAIAQLLLFIQRNHNRVQTEGAIPTDAGY